MKDLLEDFLKALAVSVVAAVLIVAGGYAVIALVVPPQTATGLEGDCCRP